VFGHQGKPKLKLISSCQEGALTRFFAIMSERQMKTKME
jgi:hypothetical protein